MKHATAASLAPAEGLLQALRQRAMAERKPGVFYRGGKAFLHFHEDPAGLFVDVRAAADWERFDVSDAANWPALLARVDQALSSKASA